MPETQPSAASLRNEFGPQFKAIAERLDRVENDLHRHQDDCREDKIAMRAEASELRSSFDQLAGSIRFSRWAMGVGFPIIVGLLIAILTTKH